jgi:hypothetical protein
MAMSDQSWEEQFKQFLQRTGEDFRRRGEDIRTEAQKLLDAAMDPEKQQKVRDRLNELGLWARRAAQDVAGAMGEAASKAETAFHSASDKVSGAAQKVSGTVTAPFATAPARKPAAKKASSAKPRAGKAAKKGASKRKR